MRPIFTGKVFLVIDDKEVPLGESEIYFTEPGEPDDMDEWLGWFFQQNPVAISYKPPEITIETRWKPE